MFSGIVRTKGEIVIAEPRDGGIRLGIRGELTGLEPGSSVAVNGVCLTVAESKGDVWFFDAVGATLERTLVGQMQRGDRVKLEDGVGIIRSRHPGQGAVWFTIGAPADLMPQIALRGSVAVDGVSLTVAEVSGEEFRVSIVPYTLEATLFGEYETGRRVHLETDVLAKYVERALALASMTRKPS